MSDIPLKNQIIEWIKPQQYWFQFAGNRLLEGALVNEELLDATYSFFKEDFGLAELHIERTSVIFNEIPIASNDDVSGLNLIAIHSINSSVKNN